MSLTKSTELLVNIQETVHSVYVACQCVFGDIHDYVYSGCISNYSNFTIDFH